MKRSTLNKWPGATGPIPPLCNGKLIRKKSKTNEAPVITYGKENMYCYYLPWLYWLPVPRT